MSSTPIKKSLVSAISLSLCLSASAVFVVASADQALANNGNGKSADRGNNGNRNQERAGRSNDQRGNSASARSNGRGAIASELKGLNAAHASPTALANASPGSMPGKLNAYKEDRIALIDVVEEQNAAYAEFQRLSGLTDDQIAEEFPDGGYDDALSNATNTYAALREDALSAQSDAQASLEVLTGGRTLSDAAMEELHSMLGL